MTQSQGSLQMTAAITVLETRVFQIKINARQLIEGKRLQTTGVPLGRQRESLSLEMLNSKKKAVFVKIL
jgi:hypothetical protein